MSAYVLGRGDPVVLLHGLGGTKITWLPLLAPLSQRYRVLVPDLPGHGESSKPKADYSARFYAHAVRQFLDAAEIDEAAIVGNSLGGRIAIELALRSPNRVSGLALLDPSLPGLRWRYVLGFTRVFPTEWGGIPFPLREQWMARAIRRLFADPGKLPEQTFDAAAAEFIRVYRSPEARMAFFSSLRHIVSEPQEPFFGSLRRIKQPSLVVFGEEDKLVPPRLGARLAEHLPNSEFMVIPNVGHVPQYEAPEVTRDAVLGFLSTLS